MRRVVPGSGAGDLVLDLAELTFIDTATARVLATAQQLLDRQNRGLTLRSPSRLTAQVLHVFGLTDLIEADIVSACIPSQPRAYHDRLDSDRRPMRLPALSDSEMEQVGR